MEGGWWRGRSHDEEAAVAFKLFLPLFVITPERHGRRLPAAGVLRVSILYNEGPEENRRGLVTCSENRRVGLTRIQCSKHTCTTNRAYTGLYIGYWKIGSACSKLPPLVLPLCEIKTPAAPLCVRDVQQGVTKRENALTFGAKPSRGAPQVTMVDDRAPHRVFKIGELTRLIADQLILISRGSAVNLACACRYLEEPVLSTLWETQTSLYTLLGTLPRDTWECEFLGIYELVVRGLYLPLDELDD